jgi:hypothetical protein
VCLQAAVFNARAIDAPAAPIRAKQPRASVRFAHEAGPSDHSELPLQVHEDPDLDALRVY